MNEAPYSLNVQPAGEAEIILQRRLRAPIDTVWDAVTRPGHFIRWWGSSFLIDVRCEMDFRVGGAWSASGQTPDGQACPMKGIFLAIEPKTRLVQTEIFDVEPFRAFPTENEMILTPQGQETDIRVVIRHMTAQARDGHLNSGMAEGAAASYAALEQLCQGLAADRARPFRLERVVEAPLDLVWEVWTQPEHVARWLGPAGSESLGCAIDLRPGGSYQYGIRLDEGIDIKGRWLIRTLEPKSLIESLVSFVDAEGLIAKHPLNPDWPLQVHSRIEFSPAGEGRTRIVIIWQAFEPTEAEAKAFDEGREAMTSGWTASLDRAESVLAGPPVMEIRRRMAHPAEAVFAAWLDPQGVGRWLFVDEGEGHVMGGVQIDARPGGLWSMKVQSPGGELDHCGRYLEIDAPRRLAFTFGVNEEDPKSVVIIEIEPLAEGCELTLRHELSGDWAEWIDSTREGWTMMIAALDRALA